MQQRQQGLESSPWKCIQTPLLKHKPSLGSEITLYFTSEIVSHWGITTIPCVRPLLNGFGGRCLLESYSSLAVLVLLSTSYCCEQSPSSYLSFRKGELHYVVVQLTNIHGVNKHLQSRAQERRATSHQLCCYSCRKLYLGRKLPLLATRTVSLTDGVEVGEENHSIPQNSQYSAL